MLMRLTAENPPVRFQNCFSQLINDFQSITLTTPMPTDAPIGAPDLQPRSDPNMTDVVNADKLLNLNQNRNVSDVELLIGNRSSMSQISIKSFGLIGYRVPTGRNN